MALACGSNVVDAGTLPDEPNPLPRPSLDAGTEVAPDTTAPDPSTENGSGCAIPDLGRYRLIFDSDGGKLERRIYSMRADGTELEALTPPGEIAREPALSPDGNYLAYTALDGIRLRTLATGESELIVPDGDQPSWSTDGQQLFGHICGYYSVPCGIVTLTLSDRTVQGYSFPYSSADPELSSDRTTLVLGASGGENSAVFGVQAFNMPDFSINWFPVPVTPIRVSHPTTSPDNVWLGAAMQCQNEQWPSLWVSPLAISTPACEGHRVTSPGAASVSNPKWGPDNLIVYERAAPPRDIAIISADTGAECLIEGPGDDRNPSWITPKDFQPPQ